jgi:hypothetical protein
MAPGSIKIGEVCAYTETWSVPSTDPAAINDYRIMFASYLFNISNTSIWNISIDSNTVGDFEERGEALDIDQGRRLQTESSEFSYVDWRNSFDLAQLFPDRLVDEPLSPYVAQALYNVIDCRTEQTTEREMGALGSFGTHPKTLMRLTMTFLTESDRGKYACLSLTTRNAMRKILAPFGMVPCRDRSYICRGELEVDPAPSPPPPDNWQVPPSPPAYVYEMLTLTTATGGTALFFLVGCVCCVAVGGHAARGRHSSRMIGGKNQRVDRMPYAKEEYALRGEEPTGPFRPDLQQPARILKTGFSFGGMDLGYDAVHQ